MHFGTHKYAIALVLILESVVHLLFGIRLNAYAKINLVVLLYSLAIKDRPLLTVNV